LQEPVAHELRQPAGISFIGCASRHIFDMGRFDQDNRQVRFHIDRFSILPGLFHGDRSDPCLSQPIRSRQQRDDQCAERLQCKAPVGMLSRRIGDDPTDSDALLMDISSSAMGKDHLHGTPPSRGGWQDTAKKEMRLRAWLSAGSEQHSSVPMVSGSSDMTGSQHHARTTSLPVQREVCSPKVGGQT
jgi:hypothetical protein